MLNYSLKEYKEIKNKNRRKGCCVLPLASQLSQSTLSPQAVTSKTVSPFQSQRRTHSTKVKGNRLIVHGAE